MCPKKWDSLTLKLVWFCRGKGLSLTQCTLGIAPTAVFPLLLFVTMCVCVRENVCACVRIPQGVAATLQGTNSVRNCEFVTEEHQRDERAVHGALAHVHIEQHGSLDYRKKKKKSFKQTTFFRLSLVLLANGGELCYCLRQIREDARGCFCSAGFCSTALLAMWRRRGRHTLR